MMSNEVFISYAWGGESEEVVNELESCLISPLEKQNISIVRDKRDLKYGELISNFMNRIGQGKAVVIVISDKYLKSQYCMIELIKIYTNGGFSERVFPIVLGDAELYNPTKRLEKFNDWVKKKQELEKEMEKSGHAAHTVVGKEWNMYREIEYHFGGPTSLLSDINSLTPEIHKNTEFKDIYSGIIELFRTDGTLNIEQDDEERKQPAFQIHINLSQDEFDFDYPAPEQSEFSIKAKKEITEILGKYPKISEVIGNKFLEIKSDETGSEDCFKPEYQAELFTSIHPLISLDEVIEPVIKQPNSFNSVEIIAFKNIVLWIPPIIVPGNKIPGFKRLPEFVKKANSIDSRIVMRFSGELFIARMCMRKIKYDEEYFLNHHELYGADQIVYSDTRMPIEGEKERKKSEAINWLCDKLSIPQNGVSSEQILQEIRKGLIREFKKKGLVYFDIVPPNDEPIQVDGLAEIVRQRIENEERDIPEEGNLIRSLGETLNQLHHLITITQRS